jgi:hypothetical protein
MVMLRLDNVKNGEQVSVRGKIRKAVLKLYFRKKFYFWVITAAFFESIEVKTQEK